jgi:hypothetical protein
MIDGNVPDAGTLNLPDPEGNSKELGPVNSNTTKLGNIDDDVPPTLDYTNPNGQVDFADTWLGTAEDSHGNIWFYFGWLRDANRGSGVISIEFGNNAPPAECDYSLIGTANEQSLIDNCNPWANRADGDTLFLWDQQGNNLVIQQREFDDANNTWGPTADLDPSIAVAAYSADGFRGEVAINLTATIFEAGKCLSVGNIIPGTITGNSDTADYKDTVLGDTGLSITNCGKVIIRKQTDPEEDPNTTSFGFSKTFPTDPATGNGFSLTDDGVKEFEDVLFGSGYQVVEDLVPSGWDFDNVNCSASTGVTPSINGAFVTFDIDEASDILDCTYTNLARGSIVVQKITDDGYGSFDFTSSTLSPSAFTLTTTAAGDAGKDSRTFSDLVPGTYDVAETVPAGWNLVSGSCDDGSAPSSIGLSAGETVTCTFHDERERGAILITKTRKHAADGPGDHPHAGVDFTIIGGELAAGGVTVTTGADGKVCYDGLVLSSFVGDYTVTETVPSGYKADGLTAKTVTVSAESTCGDGNEAGVSFGNTPLTDITVSVDSLVPGGTSSTIDCVLDSAGPGDDVSLTLQDLEPGTYTCTIVVDP